MKMEDQRIKILLERYHKGTCTDTEIEELRSWYEALGETEVLPLPDHVRLNKEEYIEDKYDLLMQRVDEAARGRKNRSVWLRLAACAVLLLGLGTSLGLYFSGRNNQKRSTTYIAKGSTDSESRYVMLPDSSIVILHAGSSIQLLDSSFHGNTREVLLTGNAYFDIHHLVDKPFIIHSGKLKVTVLGTAFSVNNIGDSVAVTVTRGKVRVEDESNKVRAILTKNQQVGYRPKGSQLNKTSVKAEQEVLWIRSGLSFNDEPMDSIALKLEKRFNLNIEFKNPAIRTCRISAAIPFEGTESLNDILSLICPAIGAEYSYKTDGTVLIDGSGCQ